MSVKITVEFATLSEAARFMLAAEAVHTAASVGPLVVTPESPITAPEAPPAPAPAEKPKKARAKKEAPQEVVAEEQANPATIDDVRAALNDLMASKGVQACQDILMRYGIARISMLEAKNYAKFIAECHA